MRLCELTSGNVVMFRNGEKAVVMRVFSRDPKTVFVNSEGIFYNMREWLEDMKHGWRSEWDIVAVYSNEHSNSNFVFSLADYINIASRLIFKQKEPKKLTVSEISKLLGYEVEIVAESDTNG